MFMSLMKFLELIQTPQLKKTNGKILKIVLSKYYNIGKSV